MSFHRHTLAGENPLREGTYEVNSISGAILSAAKMTLDACASKSWSGRDFATLLSNYSEVREKIT